MARPFPCSCRLGHRGFNEKHIHNVILSESNVRLTQEEESVRKNFTMNYNELLQHASTKLIRMERMGQTKKWCASFVERIGWEFSRVLHLKNDWIRNTRTYFCTFWALLIFKTIIHVNPFLLCFQVRRTFRSSMRYIWIIKRLCLISEVETAGMLSSVTWSRIVKCKLAYFGFVWQTQLTGPLPNSTQLGVTF